MKSKITQALVERAPAPERGKSVLYADSEMRGFYLIVTPTKPVAIASQRRQPTFSPSTGPESAATISG